MIHSFYHFMITSVFSALNWVDFLAYSMPKWANIKAGLVSFFQPLIAISQLWFVLSMLVGIVFFVMFIFMILPRK